MVDPDTTLNFDIDLAIKNPMKIPFTTFNMLMQEYAAYLKKLKKEG